MSAGGDCGLTQKTLAMWDEIVRALVVQMRANSIQSIIVTQTEGGNVRFVMEPFNQSEGGEE